jgi:hypothetical protein
MLITAHNSHTLQQYGIQAFRYERRAMRVTATCCMLSYRLPLSNGAGRRLQALNDWR